MEGNQQKMREALIIAKKAICHHAEHICQSLSWENSDLQSNCADVLCAHRELCEAKTAINAALAEPPRNCDVGTASEQEERYLKLKREHVDRMARCPAVGQSFFFPDSLYWAQMQYEEKKEGATDGE